jgi:cytochrome c553
MSSRTFRTVAGWAALALAAGCTLAGRDTGRGEIAPELAAYMGELQRQTHKLNLSVVAENDALAAFYLHEVREVVTQIEERFPQHDGHPVAELARAQLDPHLASLATALGEARWKAAQGELSELVAGCNGCHAATGHAFVRIELTTENPFNQSFGPP